MKIHYNAPFVLTYAFVSMVVVLIDMYLYPRFCQTFFCVYPISSINLRNPLSYFQFVTHVIGHADFNHFLSNFSFILLIGPALEEKYGSKKLFVLCVITALVTGILNAFFFSSALLGASGVVFMMILLSSFTNMKQGIPLTFILVSFIYLGKEVISSFHNDNISQFGHIIGGICGAVFGYILSQNPNILSDSDHSTPLDQVNQDKADDDDEYIEV